MTLLYEIHTIRRFPTVGKFSLLSRLVRCQHTSAGKNYGSPNSKIGNAYLKWAFSEIVPLIKRQSKELKAYCERIERKHSKARAKRDHRYQTWPRRLLHAEATRSLLARKAYRQTSSKSEAKSKAKATSVV